MSVQILRKTGQKIIFAITFISMINIFPGCNSFNCADNPGILKHDIKYSSKGTRSESRHGYLILSNGNRVPECFDYISNGSRAYKYIKKVRPWGDSGYVEADNVKKILTGNDVISEEILKRGWYKSDFKYSSTPVNWLYGETSAGNYFFDSSKVRNLIESENIKCSGKSGSFIHRSE